MNSYKLFSPKSNQVISEVHEALLKADYTPEKELQASFKRIFDILQEINHRVVKVGNNKEEISIRVDVDLDAGLERDKRGKNVNPEVQITISKQQKASIEKVLGKLGAFLRKKPKDTIIVLTNSGYRTASNQEELETRRFKKRTDLRREAR